jgi:hypothetical protein
MELSGCGSNMIRPSAVRFFSEAADFGADDRLPEVGPAEVALRIDGGYGDGREDADVRAGACLIPKGSL